MEKPIVLFIELKIASKNKYICEIVEKIYNNNISLNIYAEGKNASQLDNLLWTWKQESFIPHKINENNPTSDEKVIISNSIENLHAAQALVLHDPLPIDLLQKYKLIIDFAEIYHSDKKIESRKRFKELRDSNKFDIHFTHLGAFLSKKHINLEKTH